ncbi:MAG: PAS domain S-box protein [Candidatus Binatus sp.]
MDSRIDPSADGWQINSHAPRRTVASNGAAASGAGESPPPTAASFESARDRDGATTLVADGADTPALVSPMVRAGASATIAFQIGYTILDRAEYPLTFARTSPLHIASVTLGVIALAASLSPRAMRNWRGFLLVINTAIIASTAWIAVINGDSNVLVATILLFFFASGALLPWSTRWQTALEAGGTIAMLGYSMRTPDPNPRIAIAWTIVVSAAILAHLSAVVGGRYRRKLAEQLADLAENHRLLGREMELRADTAAARERDHLRLQASEASLRASHAALRKIFDATLDAIVVTRMSDGVCIDFNHQFERMGYQPQDLDDARDGKRRLWTSAEEIQDRITREGVVRNLETDFVLPDGGLMPALLSAVRVELAGEDCVVTIVRDLTAAREALGKLEESAGALRAIFDVSPDAISVAKAVDGRYVAVNAEFLRLGGHVLEQTLGRSDLELKVWSRPADREAFGATLALQGQVRNMEIEFLKRDGTRVPTLVSASTISLDNTVCVVAYIRDITDRKRIEQDLLSAREEMSRQVKALSESEETFRKLFDANLDGMTLGKLDGTYIDVNQEFVRTTGYSRDEAVGHSFTDLNLWIHPDEMTAFVRQLTTTNEVRNLEVAFRMKDGSERPVLLSAVNLELQGQLCCLTVAREISDLKMTQRELVAAREAALAASRTKSEFLSSMSHEIRTPMNSILGMADLLTETELNEEQRRYLSTVISNGHALLELINSILDLAKVESGRLSLEAVEFGLKDATEKALETLAIRAHEKGLELMVRFAPEVPELVLGDPLRLGQVLLNLIGNAIKFTEKGQVLVAVERDPDATAAGGLKFAVTDTGIGIAADKLHLLFNAFSQADSSTSRKYGGSGLGLAIVSRLVAMMHGKVAVASEPGIGSEFSFTAQFGTARTAPELRNATLDDVEIILADDNANSRSIISELLRTQGARVSHASSGAEAITELRRDRARGPRFQIALIDSAMPGVGGFEVAEHLMREGPGGPQIVMMLCTNDLTGKVGRLRAIGVDRYIVKPIRRGELFAAVARAREGVRVEPKGDRPAAMPIAPPSPSSAIVDRPLQILMADDSEDNRTLIRAYLRKTPHTLHEASNGQEAIDKFIAGNFDVVLMDIQMPIVDGYEATSTIRIWELANSRSRTPIVALTASALEEAVQHSMAAGCDAHVTKPVKKSTLLDAIHNAIEETLPDAARGHARKLKEESCRTE